MINKIKLENFKCHLNREFNFVPGINVIVGRNGAGKTSVFEALGIALFGISEKKPKDLVSRLSNQNGFFKINVEFTGKDGIRYEVERIYKPGKNSCVLRQVGINNVITDKLDEVPKYVSKLLGLEVTNFKEFFKNIMCAYQNDITTAFVMQNEESKRFFNKIFEVDVYDRIYNNFRDVTNKYETKIRELDGSINILKNDIEKYKDIDEKLSNIRGEISRKESEKEKLETLIYSLKSKKSELGKQIEDVRNLKNDLEKTLKVLENLRNNLEEISKQIVEAENARKILEMLEPSYKEFEALNEEIKQKREIEQELRKKQQVKQTIEMQVIELENKISIAEAKIKETKERLSIYDEEIQRLRSDKSKLIEEIDIKMTHSEKAKKDLVEAKKIKGTISKIYQDYRDNLNEKENIEIELSTEEEKKRKYQSLIEEIKSLQNTIDELNKELSEETRIISEKARIENELKNLENASKQLSSGICPLLNEPCQNILQVKGTDVYFESKRDYYKEKLSELLEEEKEINTAKSKKEEISKQLKEKEAEVSVLTHQIDEVDKKKAKLKQINEFIEDIIQKYGDILKLVEEADNKLNEINLAIGSITTEIESKSNQLKNIEKELEEKTNRYLNIKNEIDKLLKEKDECKDNLKALEEELGKYVDVDEKLDKLTKEIEELELEKSKHESDYKEYMINKKTAEKLEELNEKKNALESEIAKYDQKVDELKVQIGKFKPLEELESEKESIEEELERKNDELKSLERRLGELRSDERQLISQIEEREKKINQLRDFEDKKSVFSKKLELTKEFREKIKVMGVKVTEYLTRQIVFEATENYRKMTGNQESIEVDHSEGKYIFKLSDPIKGVREFNELSGGEQVSAAIALRTAIAKILANADIYILDEPTVNLDEERRKLLAENLRILLGNISQAFIITHDEEFIGKGYHEIKL